MRRWMVWQPARPIGRQQLAALGDFIDVIGEREGHDIGFEPVNDRARLLARAAVRLLDRQWLTALRLPLLGEDRINRFVQFARRIVADVQRSEEHTSELQSLMRISYAVFCLKKKNKKDNDHHRITQQTKQ